MLSTLIPIFNILKAFKRSIEYNSVRPIVLDQLSVLNVLEEMSEIEKTEYLKKSTGLNAILVPLKIQIKLSKASSITINTDDENSEIFFEMGESIKDITILKVNGTASRLTVEEQKKKVIEVYETFINTGIEEYGDVESFIKALENNSIIDLKTTDENKNIDKINLVEKSESLLKNLKFYECLNRHEKKYYKLYTKDKLKEKLSKIHSPEEIETIEDYFKSQGPVKAKKKNLRR